MSESVEESEDLTIYRGEVRQALINMPWYDLCSGVYRPARALEIFAQKLGVKLPPEEDV